jgi:hypothetical protein
MEYFLVADLEADSFVGHETPSLSRTDRSAEIGLARFAEFALAAF